LATAWNSISPDDWFEARQAARVLIGAIVEEFGEAWAGDTIRSQLEYDIDYNVGHERPPEFAPRP
jgi:hypothetical protein